MKTKDEELVEAFNLKHKVGDSVQLKDVFGRPYRAILRIEAQTLRNNRTPIAWFDDAFTYTILEGTYFNV